MFCCSFQKESPRWLISKNRLSEAHQIVFGKAMEREYLQLVQTSPKDTLSSSVSDGYPN